MWRKYALFPLKIRRQKSKNVLNKCVLDLNFAPIKGSVFLIWKKTQIRFTLVYTEVTEQLGSEQLARLQVG